MQDDLNRLIRRPPPEKRLDDPGTPRPIRGQVGLERRRAGEVTSKEVTVASTDGLFSFTVRVVN